MSETQPNGNGLAGYPGLQNEGHGGTVAPEPPAELRAMEARLTLLAGAIDARLMLARMAGITFEGARDEYAILGYPRVVSYANYRDEYARGGIAGRIVDAFPNATWRGQVELIEDEDPKTDTAFEKAWKALDTRLQIQAKLLRVDKLSQLSNYAILLIGAAGNLEEELPRGNPDRLLYLQPYSGGGGPVRASTALTLANQGTTGVDADATVVELELDPQSERFGLPKFYQLRRAGLEALSVARRVHWTRVLHVAEGLLDDDVYGQPCLERVWNLLADLRKVTGGGAEAFWLRANQGLHMNVDKDLATTDLPALLKHLKEQEEAYKHQLDRWIRTKGTEVKPLGSDVANFANPADAILTQIAGAKAIPKRILTGSEMGELASSQDRDNWKDQVAGRQTGYAGPYIVRPLVDRLIAYGYLPAPAKGAMAYEVRWPQIATLTEQEKTAGATAWASTKTAEGPVFTRSEIREKWADKAPLDEKQLKEIQEAIDAARPEPAPTPEGQPPQLAAAAGFKFSSTQVQMPGAVREKMLAMGRVIPDTDLAADGRETNPHVTVKYGLHTNDAEDVMAAVADFGRIRLTLEQTAFFDAPDYDVVYVAVSSPDLERLNALISSELEVTDTHPVYTPHATIAYVKKGLGQKYAGNNALSGSVVETDEVFFNPAEGTATMLDLGDAESRSAADAEMVAVLEAAIRAGNLEVIGEIVGVKPLEDA